MLCTGILSILSLLLGQDAVVSDQPITKYIRQIDIPYTIANSGSYALAQNISIDAGDAITIQIDPVGPELIYLNLNGYKIIGSQGSNGISVQSSSQTSADTSVQITNGTIATLIDHG